MLDSTQPYFGDVKWWLNEKSYCFWAETTTKICECQKKVVTLRQIWRMEVKVKIENGNIVRVYTMQDELFCSLELPPERGKMTNEWMANRIDHLFYEDIKSADRLDIISFVIKQCKKEGFTPRLYFDDEQSRQNIGTLIRQVRLQRGLKARDVAMLVGLAASNYCHIESGKIFHKEL